VYCVAKSHLVIANTQNEKVEGNLKMSILLMKVDLADIWEDENLSLSRNMLHPENMLVSLSVSFFD